ncbi:Ig-like domain-containing protein, partial [Acinetobacter soli]
VTISVDGGAAVGSAVVDSSGNWSYTLPTQSEGSHSYTATASNAAGTPNIVDRLVDAYHHIRGV